MTRFDQGPSFNKYKRELSASSRKVKNSLTLMLFLGFILTITSILSIFLIVNPSSHTLLNLGLLSLYDIDIVSSFYALNSILFIIYALTEIIFLGLFVYYLVQISLHAQNYFKIFTLERQEKRLQYIGLLFILYVAFSVLGFIPINYLNTTMFLISNMMLFLALFMNFRTFQTYKRQMRFIKKPSIIPLIGGIINIFSWIIMYFTIIGIYGNLIGLFLIFLGFRKLVVDFKLIASESKILMMDPSTPAPSTPIPKAPSVYDRTMIQEEAPKPTSVEDTPVVPSVVPEPTSVEDTPVVPTVVPEPTSVEDAPVVPSVVPEPTSVEDAPIVPTVVPEPTSIEDAPVVPTVVPEPTSIEDSTLSHPIAPKPSITTGPSIVAPSLTAPKPLDINQKLCPNCKSVVYKTDRVCNNCETDLPQP